MKTIYVKNANLEGALPYSIEVDDYFDPKQLVPNLVMATKREFEKEANADKKATAKAKEVFTEYQADRQDKAIAELVDAGMPEDALRTLLGGG